jgi:histone H3/H4
MFEESKPEGLIISKSRTKSAARNCNVSGSFYDALDKKVRNMISDAESRAMANGRKTIKPQDL